MNTEGRRNKKHTNSHLRYKELSSTYLYICSLSEKDLERKEKLYNLLVKMYGKEKVKCHVKQLKEKGLVENNYRYYNAYLTDEGKQLFPKVKKKVHKIVNLY